MSEAYEVLMSVADSFYEIPSVEDYLKNIILLNLL